MSAALDTGKARPAPRATVPQRAPVRTIPSQALFGEATEVRIEHNGATYRLQRTSLGKLILTK